MTETRENDTAQGRELDLGIDALALDPSRPPVLSSLESTVLQTSLGSTETLFEQSAYQILADHQLWDRIISISEQRFGIESEHSEARAWWARASVAKGELSPIVILSVIDHIETSSLIPTTISTPLRQALQEIPFECTELREGVQRVLNGVSVEEQESFPKEPLMAEQEVRKEYPLVVRRSAFGFLQPLGEIKWARIGIAAAVLLVGTFFLSRQLLDRLTPGTLSLSQEGVTLSPPGPLGIPSPSRLASRGALEAMELDLESSPKAAPLSEPVTNHSRSSTNLLAKKEKLDLSGPVLEPQEFKARVKGPTSLGGTPVEPFDKAKIFRVKFNTKVLDTPSFFGAKQAKLEGGDEVEVDAKVGHWYRVHSRKGRVGYVFSDDVEALEE